MQLPTQFPFAHQVQGLAFQPRMPPRDIIVHGIEHPRRTAAVAVRFVVHGVAADLPHQPLRPRQGTLDGRADGLRQNDVL